MSKIFLSHMTNLVIPYKWNLLPAGWNKNDHFEIFKIKMFSGGRELDEKERVTNQNVQNWFNNRRKEIKKLARAGIVISSNRHIDSP